MKRFVTNMTELDQIRLESLKKFPESILRKECRTVAICNRCNGEIPIDHPVLKQHTVLYGLYGYDSVSSPCCKLFGHREKYFAHWIVSPIPHKIVEIHEYVLKEAFYVRTGWFRKKLIPKDSIIEMVTLHDDNC